MLLGDHLRFHVPVQPPLAPIACNIEPWTYPVYSLFGCRLCDTSPAARAAAAACLGSLEATDLEGELAQALAPLLSDASGAVRAEVAAALGGLGAAARRPYLASIEALARSDDLGEVRGAARRASCSTLLPLTSCSLSRAATTTAAPSPATAAAPPPATAAPPPAAAAIELDAA